jgi:hypothetical protein
VLRNVFELSGYTHDTRPSKGTRRKKRHLRLAAPKVARVQAAVADGVLLAQPREEALETEAVAAMGGGAVPINQVSMCFIFKPREVVKDRRKGGITYFL